MEVSAGRGRGRLPTSPHPNPSPKGEGQAIPPPVVPKGTARLRVSITAGHTQEHLDHFAAVLDQGLTELGIPRDGSGVRCGEAGYGPPVSDGGLALKAVAAT